MLIIFLTVMPVFLLIMLGSFVQRVGWLPQNAATTLNQYVYYLALPALLFGAIARAPVQQLFDYRFIGGLLTGTTLCSLLAFYLFHKLFTPSKPRATFQAFTATFANAAFLGLPILLALFPSNSDAILAMSIYTLFTTPLVLLGIAMLELENAKNQKSAPSGLKRAMLGALFKNPVLVGTAAGLAVVLVGLKLPHWLTVLCDMLGQTAAPCALLGTGMVLHIQLRMRGSRQSALPHHMLTGVLKLFLHPLLVFGCMRLAEVEGEWLLMGTLLAAMPTGTLPFVLAEAYGLGQANASLAVLLTTFCAPFSITIIMALLHGAPL